MWPNLLSFSYLLLICYAKLNGRPLARLAWRVVGEPGAGRVAPCRCGHGVGCSNDRGGPYCVGTFAAIWWATLTAPGSFLLALHVSMSMATLLLTVSAR
jgi:hypothetical protein